MKISKRPELKRIAIISTLTGGLGHYCAHLNGLLSQHFSIKFITYPQLDLSGTIVKQITDSFVSKFIKWPRFDIDESNIQSIVSITEFLKDKDIKLVNLHIGTTVKKKLTYFLALILYSKMICHTKWILTLHDVLPLEEDKTLVKLLKLLYRQANQFTVGNVAEQEKLRTNFSIPLNKISVIHHGIYDLFDRNLYNTYTARSYLGLPKDKTVILFFGFLREYKGFQYLIDAVNILAKTRQDFVIYVASGLKYAPKKLVEEILYKINKHKLNEFFVLNFNYLDTVDIEPVFRASDIVTLPYTHSSQSGVLMMATGFKKPVLISDIFYDKSWIINKGGYVFKNKNSEELAKKMNKMLNEKENLPQMGLYGFNYAMKHYNWKAIAEEYAKVFNAFL